ncbi:MAG: cardiolipin synthase [Pseudomonadaceae bacterium]|nr:cardiolipin synthase [Pseudomonadaceae bacterium]
MLNAALLVAFIAGILSAIDALLRVRNPQGATAWILGLIAVPVITVPLYWMFGRVRYHDYIGAKARLRERLNIDLNADNGLLATFTADHSNVPSDVASELRGFSALANTPWCDGHELQLLIDGEATFDAILSAIDAAQSYALIQYYTVRDDEIGARFSGAMQRASKRGVHVYFLYDEIGSYELSSSYKKTLIAAGVQSAPFSGTRSLLGRFRINFRNHRKIVLIDGKQAFIGGLNVGDEYLGNSAKFAQWRDTHLAIHGPAILGLQMSFLEDWAFGNDDDAELPIVDWQAVERTGQHEALIVSTGPADEVETCGLTFTHAIECAQERLWIASPYFVPDPRVLSSLQLAAMRGVDVRILLPRRTDNPIFRFVPYAYFPDVEQVGGKVFLYEPGFMHQKVILVDDSYASVGTANLDNRSFRLNFETICVARSTRFADEVATMLEADFTDSTQLQAEDINNQPWYFDVAVAATRLMAPTL